MKHYSWNEIEQKLESLKSQLGIDIGTNNVRSEVIDITEEAYDICVIVIPKIRAARGYLKIGKEKEAVELFDKITMKIRRLEAIMKEMEA